MVFSRKRVTILDAYAAYVVIHHDTTGADTIVLLYIHTGKILTCLILRDVVVLLEDGCKILGVLLANVILHVQ